MLDAEQKQSSCAMLCRSNNVTLFCSPSTLIRCFKMPHLHQSVNAMNGMKRSTHNYNSPWIYREHARFSGICNFFRCTLVWLNATHRTIDRTANGAVPLWKEVLKWARTNKNLCRLCVRSLTCTIRNVSASVTLFGYIVSYHLMHSKELTSDVRAQLHSPQ